MEPTLKIAERVKVGPLTGSPYITQIVTFHPPEGAESERCGVAASPGEMCPQAIKEKSSVTFVKRIVAGPGDEIYIQNGHVYRKAKGTTTFVPEKDSYIRECGANPECTFSKPIVIPAGSWFMLGDNRGESDDSRFWGPVPTEWIVGVVKGQ